MRQDTDHPAFGMVAELKEKKIAQPHPHTGSGDEFRIAVVCGDPERLQPGLEQIQHVTRTGDRRFPRLALITPFGGPLVLSPEWPERLSGDAAIHQIQEAHDMTGATIVDFFLHAPCKQIDRKIGAYDPRIIMHNLLLAGRRVEGLPQKFRVNYSLLAERQHENPLALDKAVDLHTLAMSDWLEMHPHLCLPTASAS